MNKLQQLWERKKEEWNTRSPRQKWRLVYLIGKFSSDLIGVTVYGGMKNNWYSYFPGLMGILHITMVVYTIWFYFTKGEYKRGMECTCSFGLVVTILAVYWKTMTSARFKVHNSLNIAGKYLYPDDKTPSMHRTIAEAYIIKLYLHTIIILMMLLASYGIAGLTGFYAIFFVDSRYTFVGTEIPFVDSRSLLGHTILLVQQVFIAIISMLGNISIEIGVCLAYNAFALMPELIRLRSDELNAELALNGQTDSVKLRLRNICLQVHDYKNYLHEALDIYYERLFIGPLVLMYSISFSIFGQMILGYPVGYGIALCNYIILVIFCNLGENTESTNDRVLTELYNMHWYLLDPKQQKQVASLIHGIQNGTVLTIGPFDTLNFEKLTDMTKSIYQLTVALQKAFSH